MKKNNKYLYMGLSLALALSFGQVAQAGLLLDDDLTISTDFSTIYDGTNSPDVEVGYSENSNATLIVNNGAILESGSGFIASPATSTGAVTVTGTGSHWESGGSSIIGLRGHGTLNIENGGKFSTPNIDIGRHSGSTGVITVTGSGSSLITNWGSSLPFDSLLIGKDGNGALNIMDGGAVFNIGSAVLGSGSSSSIGTVTVSGTGSSWGNAGDLTVGRSGTGTLNIENGGKVTNVDGFIGRFSNKTNAVTVAGSGSRWDNSGQLTIGNNSAFFSGYGNLTINDGGVVSAANGVTIYSGSRLSGNGGTIEGDVVNHGWISPGNSPGVLTITGDLTLGSSSILLMEIFGPTAYDQLIIGGDFVAGGILQLDFGGYMPEFDTPYDLFQIAGGMSGDFSEIKFLNPAAGFDAGLLSLSFAGGESGGMFQLIMANNGDPGNNTVPEPASTLLFGFGALALLWVRRRNSWA